MTVGGDSPENPLQDSSMQAELDVSEMGLAHPEAVDLGMQIWSKGLVAGISFAALRE